MWSEYLLQDVAQAVAGEELVLVGTQVQRDFGAARRLLDGLDRVVALAGALPAHAVLGAESGAARDQRHAVGDDERRIEPDAELADEVRVFGAIGRELLEELARARPGDRADVLDHLLPRHADTVVGYRDRARGGVAGDPDDRLRVVLEERGVGQRLEAELVRGIRGVGDQLAQEISLLPYNEWIIRWSSWLTSAWKPSVSLVVVSLMTILESIND